MRVRIVSRFIRLACFAVCALLVGLPAAAAASSVEADRACYGPARDMMTLTGAGYTPGGSVSVELAGDGQGVSYTATADAAGAFTLSTGAPPLFTLGYRDTFRAGVTIAATDQPPEPQSTPGAFPVQIASARVTLTGLDVAVKPWDTKRRARGRPGHIATFQARGWTTEGPNLYAHYLRAGKLVHTVTLGRLTGDCGDLIARMDEFAFRPVRAGVYRVQFDTSRHYATPGETNESTVRYKTVVVARKDAIR